MQKITDITIVYLKHQVKAGADTVQVFDSWAGSLSPADFKLYAQPYLFQIAEALKDDRSQSVQHVVGIQCGAQAAVRNNAHFVEFESLIAGASDAEPLDQMLGGPMFYTSGTTGRPNGVQVTHRNVCNVLLTAPGNLGMKPGMIVGQILNIAFDMAAWEILGCLAHGATLHIRTQDIGQTARLCQVLSERRDQHPGRPGAGPGRRRHAIHRCYPPAARS